MKSHKRRRDAASEALIALRTAMGKTQQQFAVENLKSAITTIARYESSNPPPRGDALLRLAKIAEQEGFFELRDRFKLLFIEHTLKDLPSLVTINGRGFLLTPLEGDAPIRGAMGFLNCLKKTKSDNPKVSRRATEDLYMLYDRYFKSGNPEDDAIRESLAYIATGKRR